MYNLKLSRFNVSGIHNFYILLYNTFCEYKFVVKSQQNLYKTAYKSDFNLLSETWLLLIKISNISSSIAEMKG